MLVFGLPFLSLAQQPTLKDKLTGKATLEEIMQVVDQHYADIEAGKIRQTDEPDYKHWARWAWYASGRLGDNGEFVDVNQKLDEARRTLERDQQRSSMGSWGWLGPYSSTAQAIGRVDRIAFHPTNPNIIYAGCPSGGLWRTTSGGTLWYAMTDFLPSIGIGGIVVDHANPNIIYVLTGDGDGCLGGYVSAMGYTRRSAGVYKSYDGGYTWQETGTLPVSGAYYGYDLVQDPNNANILLAATSNGLFKTVNGGASWYEVLSGRISDVKYRPGSSTGVYAARWGGDIRYSTNGGESWTASTFYPALSSAAERVEIAVSNESVTTAWALIGPAVAAGEFEGLYLTINGGQTFVQVLDTPNILGGETDGTGEGDQAWYDHSLAVSHTNSIHVVTGGIRVWRTTSSPSSMVYVGGTHADVHDLAFNPLDNKLWAGTDGGIYSSTNLGDTWTFHSGNGLMSTQIYHMSGTTVDNNRVIMGTQDNGVQMRQSNSSSFTYFAGGDGFDSRFDPGSSTSGIISSNRGVYRFWNSGSNVTGNIAPSDTWFPTLEVHKSNANIKFYGGSDVYKTEDNGSSWDNIGASGTWAMTTCPSNHQRIYVAGGAKFNSIVGEVYRSDNLGSTWTVISDNPGFPAGDLKITDISVHPTNSNLVWITVGGFSDGNKVFYSGNAGGSWTNMSGDLPNIPVNCVVVSDLNMAYIGTDLGVFYRNILMPDWMPFYSGLPNVPVTDLFLNPSIDRIRAGTFGRGVWESDLFSNCPNGIGLTQQIWGRKLYEASNYITVSGDITRGENSQVTMKAGGYVRFLPGFSITPGSTLHAYIAACGTQGIPDE